MFIVVESGEVFVTSLEFIKWRKNITVIQPRAALQYGNPRETQSEAQEAGRPGHRI